MEYFRIKNWDKYQHRDATRNGPMPWIKLYVSALHDHKSKKMSPSQFGLWCRLLLITGELGNKIPLDPPFLRSSLAPLNFRHRLDLQFMWDLGLIEKWSAGLDEDKTKTKTQTKTLVKPKIEVSKKSGWQNPAQERLENNLRVAKILMEPEHE
jgi:hypothetical protein